MLAFIGWVHAWEREDLQNYENKILFQWEQIIQAYLWENNISISSIDTKSDEFLWEILTSLQHTWDFENLKILNEYYGIITRKPIWDYPEIQHRIIPVQDNQEISQTPQNESYDTEYTPFQITYNRNAAKNYALSRVFNPNPNYNYYTWLLNCTNFVSQILEAWWLTYIGTPSYINKFLNSKWYYSHGGTSGTVPSFTWWGAHNSYLHMAQSNIFEPKYLCVDARIWDVVQIDYDSDGEIDHSMVITKITENGNNDTKIYVTYNNMYGEIDPGFKNRQMADIISEYPKENNTYYIWHVK